MASFNRVILAGNLTRDPELKVLESGTTICNFGLAVNRKWRDQEGQVKEDVCFVDLACFGRTAEVANQYLTKGKPLLVEGRLKFDNWTDREGNRRSKLSVVVEHLQFLGSGTKQDGAAGGDPGAPADPGDPDIPF